MDERTREPVVPESTRLASADLPELDQRSAGRDMDEEVRRLNLEIRICRLCPLCESRTVAVPGEGPNPSDVMLVGEAPGAQEDKAGRPFVGNSGRMLDRLLERSGINRKGIFITGAVKCRPPGLAPFERLRKICRPGEQPPIERSHPRTRTLGGRAR